MSLQRSEVAADLEIDVREPADLVLSIAVAGTRPLERESLAVTVDGADLPAAATTELVAPVGSRLHRIASAPPGRLRIAYSASVPAASTQLEASELDPIEYTRPSRYCDSDRLAEIAHAHFAGLSDGELVDAVVQWVLTNLSYAPGSSGPVDGALDAYLRRRGVCRDTAHLVVTFLRARGLPARVASVYAPGLRPMDFHAVTEVCLDGRWWVVDGTGLAPRPSLVRIATGRDAADTAFLTVNAGRADLVSLTVNAVAEPGLPGDDGRMRVALS